MKMKGDLENQFQKWQKKVDSKEVGDRDIFMAENIRISYRNKIKTHRGNLENSVLQTCDEEVKEELQLLITEVLRFILKLNKKVL